MYHLHGFLTGLERLVELAVKKMFMKESIILSLADPDDFTNRLTSFVTRTIYR